MKFFRLLYDVAEGMVQLLYPPICLTCQNTIHDQTSLKIVCRTCLQNIQTINPQFVQDQILRRLSPCYLDDVRVIFAFDKTVQAIIHQIKYRKSNRLAQNFSEYARSRYPITDSPSGEGDLVAPVPLFPLREKERGFNQSLYIARGFFPDSSHKIYRSLLTRIRRTATQTELTRQARKENVAQAFSVSGRIEIREKTVVLIDDVITTGATLNECARTLKAAGAGRVIGLTLATPVDDDWERRVENP